MNAAFRFKIDPPAVKLFIDTGRGARSVNATMELRGDRIADAIYEGIAEILLANVLTQGATAQSLGEAIKPFLTPEERNLVAAAKILFGHFLSPKADPKLSTALFADGKEWALLSHLRKQAEQNPEGALARFLNLNQVSQPSVEIYTEPTDPKALAFKLLTNPASLAILSGDKARENHQAFQAFVEKSKLDPVTRMSLLKRSVFQQQKAEELLTPDLRDEIPLLSIWREQMGTTYDISREDLYRHTVIVGQEEILNQIETNIALQELVIEPENKVTRSAQDVSAYRFGVSLLASQLAIAGDFASLPQNLKQNYVVVGNRKYTLAESFIAQLITELTHAIESYEALAVAA